MSYVKYQEKKKNVINTLEDIRNLVEEEEIKEIIDKKKSKLLEDRFTIAVFGHFSNGKSTFLNALMGYGEEVLKEDEVASTATITKLAYPEDINMLNKARIIYSNGQESVVDCYDIKGFTARNDEVNVEKNIKEVIVYFDSPFLKNGVQIVDTPGFNSTYILHDDIAKSYIKKADASIFLFSAEKPGAAEEIKFLKDINENMGKIFFVLNKIDICNTTEGKSIETNCLNLKNKLVECGLVMDGKKVYPISSLKKKESIKENSEMKNKESMFDIFSEELSNYLTGDENSKDRLASPIISIMKELIDHKNVLNERVQAYMSNKEQIEEAISNEKKNAEQLEEQINDKSKYINKEVGNVIRKSEKNIKEKTNKLEEDFCDTLNGIKSEFSVRLYDFSDMNSEIMKSIIKVWGNEKEEIENNFSDLISEIVDVQAKVEEIQRKIMPIIDNSLKIQNIDIDEPNFNFEAVNEIDEEIKKCKEEYKETRKKADELRKGKVDKDISEIQYNEMKAKIRRLEDEKRSKINNLGDGKIIQAKTTVYYKEKREGILGAIGNVLFGPKEKERIEDFLDDSDYKHVKNRTNELNSEYVSIEKTLESELNEFKSKIIQYGGIDSKLRDYEEEVNDARESYLNKTNNSEKKKLEMQMEIINITKSQYREKIRSVLEDFQNDTRNFLKNSKNLFIKILLEAIEKDKKDLEAINEKIYYLYKATEINPEEIDKKIKEIYINIDENNQGIEKLRNAKEEI